MMSKMVKKASSVLHCPLNSMEEVDNNTFHPALSNSSTATPTVQEGMVPKMLHFIAANGKISSGWISKS